MVWAAGDEDLVGVEGLEEVEAVLPEGFAGGEEEVGFVLAHAGRLAAGEEGDGKGWSRASSRHASG